MLLWVRTLVGRQCRCWAWCFLSLVVIFRVALRVRLLTAKIREFSEPSCRIGVDLRRLGMLAHWNDGTGVKRVFERRLLKLLDSLPAIARYRVPPLKVFYEETMLRHARLGFQRPPNDGFCVFMGTDG